MFEFVSAWIKSRESVKLNVPRVQTIYYPNMIYAEDICVILNSKDRLP